MHALHACACAANASRARWREAVTYALRAHRSAEELLMLELAADADARFGWRSLCHAHDALLCALEAEGCICESELDADGHRVRARSWTLGARHSELRARAVALCTQLGEWCEDEHQGAHWPRLLLEMAYGSATM